MSTTRIYGGFMREEIQTEDTEQGTTPVEQVEVDPAGQVQQQQLPQSPQSIFDLPPEQVQRLLEGAASPGDLYHI